MVGIPISNQLEASMQEILRSYIDEIIQAVCIVHKSECEIDDVNMISPSRKKYVSTCNSVCYAWSVRLYCTSATSSGKWRKCRKQRYYLSLASNSIWIDRKKKKLFATSNQYEIHRFELVYWTWTQITSVYISLYTFQAINSNCFVIIIVCRFRLIQTVFTQTLL